MTLDKAIIILSVLGLVVAMLFINSINPIKPLKIEFNINHSGYIEER